MSEKYTKLDRIWDKAKFFTREFFNQPPAHYMHPDDARKLFAQGKNIERMVEELKAHCIKNDTAHYDEYGVFHLKGEK
jgi:hypothetical protein